MRKILQSLWLSRAPRERLVIAWLLALVGAVSYVSFVESAYRARNQLEKSVATLRAQAIRVDRSADEIGRLRALPASQPSVSMPDLRTLMQAKIDSAALGGSLRSIEPLDASHVRVTFGAVPFADWLAWVESLQLQQIRLDTTRIEALATPGLVSATGTFIRTRP